MDRYGQLCDARRAIADPMSNPVMRRQAGQMCDQVMKSPQECAEFGLRLVREQQELLRHFGLQLLLALVTHYWNQVPNKEQMRSTLLQLGEGMINDTRLIKEKLASVWSSVAKKEVPQRWPTFFEDVIGFSNASPAHCDLAILTLRRFAEDVVEFSEDLTNKRQRKLLEELKKHLEEVLAFIVQGLMIHVANAVANPQSQQLCVSLLLALESYLPWGSFTIIFKGDVHGLLSRVLAVPVHSLRLLAAKNLTVLMKRTNAKPSQIIQLLFLMDNMEPVATALASLEEDPGERLAFLRAMCDLLVEMGLRHIELTKTQWRIPRQFQQFVTTVMQFFSHPHDLIFANICCPYLYSLLNVSQFQKTPVFQELMGPFAVAVASKSAFGLTRESIAAISAFLEEDGLDDQEETAEREHWLSSYTHQIGGLMRRTARYAPQHCLNWLLQQFEQLFPYFTTLQGEVKGSNAHRAVKGLFDTLARITQGIQWNQVEKDPQVQTVCQRLIRLVFEFAPPDPLLLAQQIKGLGSFSFYYEKRSDVLFPVLEKLLSLVQLHPANVPPETPLHSFPRDVLRLRKKAADSFKVLCVSLFRVVTPMMPHLMDHVGKKLIGSALLNDDEKAVLRQALIAVIVAIPSLEEQHAYMSLVMGAVVQVWCSDTFTEMFGDPQNLLTFVGAAPGAELQLEGMRALLNVVTAFHTTLELCGRARKLGKQDPSLPFLKAVLPNTMSLVRCIHLIWTTGPAQTFLASVYPECFAISAVYYTQLLGKKFDRSAPGRYLAQWLGRMRTQAYSVLGEASARGDAFYGIARLSEVLHMYVFAGINDMSVPHLTELIKIVIKPLVMNVPESMYASFLGPMLPPLLHTLLKKLQLCWGFELAVARGSSNIGAEDEIVQSKLSMDYARQMFSLLNKMLSAQQGPRDIETPLCRFCLTNSKVAFGILAILCHALAHCRDSPSLGHAIVALESVLPLLLRTPALHNVIGTHVMTALLIALSRRSNHDHNGLLLKLLTQCYIGLSQQGGTIARQAMLRIPGVKNGGLAIYETKVRAAGKQKKQRMHTAALLENWVGEQKLLEGMETYVSLAAEFDAMMSAPAQQDMSYNDMRLAFL